MPCANENSCAVEFTSDFRTYCHIHFDSNTVNTSEQHDVDELCAICSLELGEHNPMKSIQLICCSDKSWYHKNCLKELAFSMKDEFACPVCGSKDEFQYNMLANGVYIPDDNYLPNPEAEIEDVPQAKRRRIHKNYVHEKTFESKADAAAYIEAENCWSYHYENKTTAGIRINYRCNLMKFRGTQCTSGLYLLFDSTNANVHLFRADAVHTHDDENNKHNAVVKISGALETEIRSLLTASLLSRERK